jgi:hypothetical protein
MTGGRRWDVTVHQGDCRDVLQHLEVSSIHALVTDPPAGIAFDGLDWDDFGPGPEAFREFMTQVMRGCVRVLKPGAHAVVWALPRTSHHTAVAMEAAGFEIRDVITHIFGSGIPKSLRLGRTGGRWSGWGTALKPASEHWILARKPLAARTVAANLEEHGTGALNIDACRVGEGPSPSVQRRTAGRPVPSAFRDAQHEHSAERYREARSGEAAGRWPANVVVTDEVLGAANRFFYVAKPSRAERAGNDHPTVKPVALMRHLCALVTPPGGVVLDCFAGSGTTLVAAAQLGLRCIGIERDARHCRTIRGMRSLHRSSHGPLLETTPQSSSGRRLLNAGRTLPFDRRPILLRELDALANRRPNADEVDVLLATLTERDIAILTALEQHHILDREQVRCLFFDGKRKSQKRILSLRDRHLIHRWMAMQPPGWHRRNAVLLLSARGAWALATTRGADARGAVVRAREGARRCFHVLHDLESNWFFIRLAMAGRRLEGEGLFHWLGEDSCRRLYRERGARLTPDGWGRYLTPEGEVVFLLEWDRGTESPARIRQKADWYVDHFTGKREAELNNVLFVAPTEARVETLRGAVADRLRLAGDRPCCSFWFTTAERLATEGPLATPWAAVTGGAVRQLAELPAFARSERRVEDSICKPAWWERRPGGSESW